MDGDGEERLTGVVGDVNHGRLSRRAVGRKGQTPLDGKVRDEEAKGLGVDKCFGKASVC